MEMIEALGPENGNALRCWDSRNQSVSTNTRRGRERDGGMEGGRQGASGRGPPSSLPRNQRAEVFAATKSQESFLTS